MFTLKLDKDEINSLAESLTELRKFIVRQYEGQGLVKSEALENPLFVEACKLQFKVALTINPSTTVKLQDFLNYGNEGKNN